MTCIVGLKIGMRVWIGADALSGSPESMQGGPVATPKVIRVGPTLMGFTTSWRMGQVLQYQLNLPQIETWDLWRWMSVEFVDACRQAMKSAGYLYKENEQEFGGQWLVAVRGQLFAIHSDFQVEVPSLPYAACGCGAPYALGAMHAAHAMSESVTPDMAPHAIRTSLEAAAEFSMGVRGPFTVEEL